MIHFFIYISKISNTFIVITVIIYIMLHNANEMDYNKEMEYISFNKEYVASKWKESNSFKLFKTKI